MINKLIFLIKMNTVYQKYKLYNNPYYQEEDLKKTIDMYKHQYDNEYNTNYLQQLQTFDIDYLSTLDYIDLRNLCQTNKFFNNICDNDNIIKTILFNRTGIIFPKDMNVAKTLKNFDNHVMSLITDNYIEYPKWVNKELFIMEHRRTLYESIANHLAQIIEDDYIKYTSKSKWKKYNDEVIKINLFNEEIDTPFVSKNFEFEGENMDYQIKLKDFSQYIIYGIYNNTSNITNYHDLYDIISNLMLIYKKIRPQIVYNDVDSQSYEESIEAI